jgi:4,5:9,10-diseco-3-hydroxy-5,9,17-trioxoandrosta-1(10),2-diene-4-oate hydrolase
MATTDLTFESTRGSVEVGEYQVTFNEAGEGPVLIMLHGGGPGATGWSNFANNLSSYAKYFRTILVNLPGFGGSGYPEKFENHYLTFAGDVLVGFLDQLGVGSAHLLGNSLGAAVAVRCALDHHQRVDRLVLMGTGSALSIGLFAPRPSEGGKILQAFTQPPGPSREKMENFLRALVYNQELITPELVDQRYAAATEPSGMEGNRAMSAGYNDPRFARDGELWRVADEVQHETLITWGKEDRVQPLDGAFVALNLMQNARLHIIPRCGHWAQADQKAEFERVTISFLTGLPA